MISSTPIPSKTRRKNEKETQISGGSSSPTDVDVFEKTIQKTIDSLQTEQLELKKHVTGIDAEHRRLKTEFLSSMEDNVEKLSQLIGCTNEEKSMMESILGMWHIAVEEIEYLEKLLAEKTSGTELQERIEEVKAEYKKALESLSEELAVARIELRSLKNDIQNKNSQLDENKKFFENVSVELAKKEKQIKDAFLKGRDMSSKIMNLETILSESKKMLSEKDDEISSLRKNSDELLSVKEELKKQNAEFKAQKVAAQKEAKENLLTTEKAILEKEEAVFKEQQAVKEIQLLKNSINQTVEHAVARYKSEIQNLEQQFGEKSEAMIKEIQTLELENNEKQSLYERVVREKEAIESELQSLYHKNANGTPVSTSVFEDICKKLTEVERTKKEVELETEAQKTVIKDMKISHEHEMQQLQDECKRLRARLQNLQTDFSDILFSRTQLSNEVELLKKRCHKAEKELANIKIVHQNDIYLLEQKLQKKDHLHHHQIQMTEEQHKRAVAELQHLLDAQYDINNKWKDEVQELTKKFESKIKDLYEDNVRLHQQNEEFSRTLQQKQIGPSAANYSSPYGVDADQMGTFYVNR